MFELFSCFLRAILRELRKMDDKNTTNDWIEKGASFIKRTETVIATRYPIKILFICLHRSIRFAWNDCLLEAKEIDKTHTRLFSIECCSWIYGWFSYFLFIVMTSFFSLVNNKSQKKLSSIRLKLLLSFCASSS